MTWFLSLSCLLVLVTALPPRLIQAKQSFDDLPSSPISHSQHDPLHYFIDIEIGYPPQNASLLVDTGSSDTWVSDPKACHNCTFSTYNVSASETSAVIEKGIEFFSQYSDPDIVKGFFASDDFNIAETTVLNVSFGVVNYTALNLPNRGGILGMGLDGFQTIAAQTGNPLPSILDLLKTQEVIDTTSFGITLGGRAHGDPAPGEITFGGYNPSRISGPLLPLPLAPSPDQFARLNVWMSSVSLTVNNKTTNLRPERSNSLGVSTTLDTGNPNSNIPYSMYYQLISLLRVNPKNNEIDCQYYRSNNGGLTYTFYGFDGKYAEIWVPFWQIIQYSPPACRFTVYSEIDCSIGGLHVSCPTLGADFLRAAYIYVNYDNSTVSMAQAAYPTSPGSPFEFDKIDTNSQARLII